MQKRVFSIILSLVMIFSMFSFSVIQSDAATVGYWEWDINAEDKVSLSGDGCYHISTGKQLAWVMKQVNQYQNSFSGKTIKIDQDIDLTDHYWMPIGYYGNKSFYEAGVIGIGHVDWKGSSFQGTFDGQGHTIKYVSDYGNMFDKNGNTWYVSSTFVGLFGLVENAKIINTFVQATIDCKVKGRSDDGSSYNYSVGGLIGKTGGDCEIRNCSARTTVKVKFSDDNNVFHTDVGGLIGRTETANSKEGYVLENSCSSLSCNFTSFDKDYCYLGGLIGRETSFLGRIENCYGCFENMSVPEPSGTKVNIGLFIGWIGSGKTEQYYDYAKTHSITNTFSRIINGFAIDHINGAGAVGENGMSLYPVRFYPKATLIPIQRCTRAAIPLPER